MCAAGVGNLLRLEGGLDSPVRRGMVVVRLAGRLLGLCEVRALFTGWTVTRICDSPVFMRKDLEGEAREGAGVGEECLSGGATLRRVYACAEIGEEGRCNGSGDEPERDDMTK